MTTTSTSTRDDAAALITTFVSAGGLSRSAVAIKNALPHFLDALSGSDYIDALRNLGADLQLSKTRLNQLADADLPCLFLTRVGPAQLVLSRNKDQLQILTAGDAAPEWITAPTHAGTAVRIDTKKRVEATDEAARTRASLAGFRGIVAGLFAASLFTNLIALAAPILVMVIYDRIIPTKSIDTILAFAIAAVAVVALDVSLRAVRSMAVAHMGSHVERALGLALFRKLSNLPLSNLEKSGIHEQIARLRQFESFRDVFSGSLFTLFLDLPFVLIFVAVVFYLTPQVGLFILGVVVIFLVASLISLTVQKSLGRTASAAKSDQQQLLYETSKNVTSIQRLGAEEFWMDRLEQATLVAAKAARKAKTAQMTAQACGQSLMMIAGAGAIALGAASALAGDVTIGELIALLTLVWRILGPFQALYSGVSQLSGFVSSLRQIRRVLSLEGEVVSEENAGRRKRFSGRIEIRNVSHRFDPTQDPVLSGVSLSIQPGKVTVFCGSSGSGRSTLFNLMNRLYTPTSGAIYFDDVDYRQIDVSDLRRAVTLERQRTEFFHGTIRQNFELANPDISDEEIAIVLKSLGLDDYIAALPDGVETRMDEVFQSKMSKSLGKGLGLARSLLRDSEIYLFNEPCSGLDETHEHKFLTCLKAMKNARTVLMTSDRPSHWEIADHLVFLDRGKVVIDAPRAEALPRIRAMYQQSGTAR